MNCPYCGGQMQEGYLACYKGSPIWYGEGDKISAWDRFAGGAGQLTAANPTFFEVRIPARYCNACQKMIINTKVLK